MNPVRRIAQAVYRPWAMRYIKRPHRYRFMGIQVDVPVGVFHPGLFFSTKLLARRIAQMEVRGVKALEMGSGAGFLSVLLASKGAQTVSVDINPKAVEATRKNAHLNDVEVECLCSDLFSALSNRQFDLMVINPPYFKKAPKNHAEMAWFAGENLEYFQNLFDQLGTHLAPGGRAILSASDQVDMDSIEEMARGRGFQLSLIRRKWTLIEWHCLYEICTLN